MNYQFLLREKNAQMGGLSTVEGLVYIFGPIIVEPFVLFGVVLLGIFGG